MRLIRYNLALRGLLSIDFLRALRASAVSHTEA